MGIATDKYAGAAREMLALYEESERRMIKAITNRLARGINDIGWTERKYAEIIAMRTELQIMLADLEMNRGRLVNEAIIDAYTGAAEAFRQDAATHPNPYVKALDMGGNSGKAAAIIADLTERLDAADRTILRKANDAFVDIIGRTTALVANGTITYRQAVQEEVENFAARGITSFVDAAGRNWEMSTYAEMATLTAIERATREGYVNTMQDYGYDLAIISAHAGACPLCVAWEDVIISVSGNNRDYPSLSDAENGGCFHPRCLHFISTYYEGITEGGRNAPREVQPPSEAYSARAEKRNLERLERQWKRKMEAAITPQAERRAYAFVRDYQQKIRETIAAYNANTPESVDRLMRDHSHEGGRVKLSPEARELPPVKVR